MRDAITIPRPTFKDSKWRITKMTKHIKGRILHIHKEFLGSLKKLIFDFQRGADEQPRRGLSHPLVRRIEDPTNKRTCSSAPRSAGESPDEQLLYCNLLFVRILSIQLLFVNEKSRM